MRTVTLFDICNENYIDTVQYTANYETIQRWVGRNLVGFSDNEVQYAYIEPDAPEHYVDFDGENPLFSDIDFASIDWDVYQLASILHHEYNMQRYRLYFYQSTYPWGEIKLQISGID